MNMPRLPTGPYQARRTGCYGCVRESTSDGSCGIRGYPCVHYGLDLFADSPDVFAPESGVIMAVSDGRTAPFQGYGPGVILMLGLSGYYHLLSHLRAGSITVRPGVSVAEGQFVGRIEPEVAHVHYEVRREAYGPSATNTIDPLLWLNDQLVAARTKKPRPEAEPTLTRKVFIGLAVTAGAVGAGVLAFQLAKSAATARTSASRRRILRPA